MSNVIRAVEPESMGVPSRNRLSPRWIALGLVGFSALFTLAHAGPLNGSLPALLIIVLVQLYLPGWLLFHALHMRTSNHPIVRLAWILAAGLSVTIPLAGIFRLLSLPVEGYLLTLHLLMLALAFWQKPAPEPLDWGVLWRHWYLYTALAVCCLIGLIVGVERSQFRFSGWEDQTVFISAANWFAHDPADPDLPSRQVSASVTQRDRWITDGWTFEQAGWEWSTGVPSATTIWYLLTPLFSWMTPLLTFALGYELTRRERHAFYCAAALTLISLLSVEPLVYSSSYAYGANVFAQMNTLRTFSTAIMLPLVLMIGLNFLRQPQKQKAVIVLLALITIAQLHARQITIAAITLAAFGGLTWLTIRTRRRLLITCVLLLLTFIALTIPFAQDVLLRAAGAAAGISVGDLQAIEDDAPAVNSASGLPDGIIRVGNFLVVDPHVALRDPLVVIAIILGLTMLLWGWKRRENLFCFGITLALILALFTPGIAGLFIKVVTPREAESFILMLPLGIIIGTTADHVVGLVQRRRRLVEMVSAAALALIALVLIFEPIPIPASAKDRINAANELQSDRNILPADQALLNLFASAPDLQMKTPTVVLAPNRIANYFVESVTDAEVVGGRVSENPQVQSEVDRFYMAGDLASPFLDSDDLQLIAHWGVQIIVTETDDARSAALLIEPTRFQLLHQVNGYLVFRVLNTQSTPEDALFKQMDTLYVQQKPQRWLNGDFDLSTPGSNAWKSLADQWRALLTANPNDDLARYGAAASDLLAGDDAQALPDWQRLQQTYPQSSLFRQASAETLLALGKSGAGRDLLIAALTDADDGTRAVAARTLLQPAFFPTLNDQQMAQIVSTINGSPEAWTLLAVYDQPDAIRRYAALLIANGSLAAADQQLASLPPVETRPEDLQMRAEIQLSQHNVDGALALLQPYLSPDTYAAAATIHPDRWKVNSAAGLYYLLEGDSALVGIRWNDAISDYQKAIANGMVVAGDTFLARAQTMSGDTSGAQATLDALAHSGVEDAQFWSLVGQFELAQTTHDTAGAQAAQQQAQALMPDLPLTELPQLGSLLFVPPNLHTELSNASFNGRQTVTVTSEFGQINLPPYSIQNWELIVFDPTSYHRDADLTLPALLVPGAITDWNLNVTLDPTTISAKVGVLVQASDPLIRYAGVYAFPELTATSEGSS